MPRMRGSTSVLVLMNGRRMVHSPFLFGAVDTNFIPLAAIGRVEVLKDGAAATYGSDAVGGVVNFITKENLRGFDVGGDFKHIEDSDGDYTVSAAYGWGNDRMSGLFAAGFQHRSELFVRDRDWAARDYLENPQGGWSASGHPHSFIPIGVVAPSPANPLGVASAVPIRDPQCGPLGGFPGAAVDTVESSMADLFVIDKFHADKAWAKERRPALVATVEKRLAALELELAGRSYLLGDELGAADILMTSALRMLQHTDMLDAAPNVAAYKVRCEARPAWGKIYAAYEQRLAA